MNLLALAVLLLIALLCLLFGVYVFMALCMRQQHQQQKTIANTRYPYQRRNRKG